jgi:hypothetical protein
MLEPGERTILGRQVPLWPLLMRHSVGPGNASRPGPFPKLHEIKMTAKRKRTRQSQSLQERLLTWAEKARQQARRLPPGREREMLLRRAKQNEVTSDLADWLILPGPEKREG